MVRIILAINLFAALLGFWNTPSYSQSEPLVPLERVYEYLATDKRDMTDLQRSRLETGLVGREYDGLVRVFDVKENGKAVSIEYFNFPTQSELKFLIETPALKDVAAELKRGNLVHITATLKRFYVDDGSVSDGFTKTLPHRNVKVVAFDHVQTLELAGC